MESPSRAHTALWLLFIVPYAAFSAHAILALSLKRGVFGLVQGALLACVALPFWRAICRRPTYAPLSALLSRYRAKTPSSNAGFADASDAGLEWTRAIEAAVETFADELSSFARANAKTSLMNASSSAADSNSAMRDDGTGTGTPASPASPTSPTADEHPTRALLRSGWGVVPILDECSRPNALAAARFPRTSRAIAAANGFDAKFSTLAGRDVDVPRVGECDGYHRAHVVVLAEGGHERGAVVGVEVGGQRRTLRRGDVVVANDHLESRWFRPEGEDVDAACVLSFDVMKRAFRHCRAGVEKHRREHREALVGSGDGEGGASGGGVGAAVKRVAAAFARGFVGNLG
jgi:hypothetical protein